MRCAIGLFHFNPHWDWDDRVGQRHCSESLGPFLQALLSQSDWKVTLEISGSGLEYLEKHFPHLLASIRDLADRGQLELISSLYTPNLWPAFPARDLRRSVQMNRKVITRLGLPVSRLFFAQEAFFGTGLVCISDLFDAVVCKDDYLYAQLPAANPDSLYRLGNLKVVVASNHIVNEIAHTCARDTRHPSLQGLRPSHFLHLAERAKELGGSESDPAAYGKQKDLEWMWYHCGDGNYVGSLEKPSNLAESYFDPGWHQAWLWHMHSYQKSGYDLTSLSCFLQQLDYSSALELPPLLEGSWNPAKAQGLFCWMGQNNSPSEKDNKVLTTASQARRRVVRAEEVCAAPENREAAPRLEPLIDEAWRHLLKAQISDALGWQAGPRAVQNALDSAAAALVAASRALHIAGATLAGIADPTIQCCHGLPQGRLENPTPVGIEVNGSETNLARSQLNCDLELVECAFSSGAGTAGVSFTCQMEEIVYCPSGRESSPAHIARHGQWAEPIVLPLANGLLRLFRNVFLIKDTGTVHVAARLWASRSAVSFDIESRARTVERHQWRFYIVRGAEEQAVALANAINAV